MLKQQFLGFAPSSCVFTVLKMLQYVNRCCAAAPLQGVPRKFIHTTVVEVKGGDNGSQFPATDAYARLYDSEEPL